MKPAKNRHKKTDRGLRWRPYQPQSQHPQQNVGNSTAVPPSPLCCHPTSRRLFPPRQVHPPQPTLLGHGTHTGPAPRLPRASLCAHAKAGALKPPPGRPHAPRGESSPPSDHFLSLAGPPWTNTGGILLGSHCRNPKDPVAGSVGLGALAHLCPAAPTTYKQDAGSPVGQMRRGSSSVDPCFTPPTHAAAE